MSWLSDKELIKKIKLNGDRATRRAFGGVYPIDKLPSQIPYYPFLMIVNTQSHNLPGEHWISIFINEKREGEVFDSLATPSKINLMRWMNRHTRRWKRNYRRYQHPYSDTCGAFSLFYVLQRCSSDSLESITKTFDSSYMKNENIVRAFYNRLK